LAIACDLSLGSKLSSMSLRRHPLNLQNAVLLKLRHVALIA